jgi:hypothetical protein
VAFEVLSAADEDSARLEYYAQSTRRYNIPEEKWSYTYLSICICVGNILKIKIYRNIILPVDLYGCETWLLTLREERRLRVFENRVLSRVFGP